jgi:hypothetical protein
VVLEGNNITIQNAADLTSDGTNLLTSTVNLKSDGSINVGHEVTSTVQRDFYINGQVEQKDVRDYKTVYDNGMPQSGYTASPLSHDSATVNECLLVHNVYDLQNMDSLINKYNPGYFMLAEGY